jgi:hypothetical protein
MVVGSIVGFVFSMVYGTGEGGEAGIFGFAAFGLFVFFSNRTKKKAMARVAEIDKVKPGFEDFYKAWRRQQDAEASQLLGSLAVGAAMAGAEEVHRRERIRSDVRVAKDEWRKR